MAIMACLVLPHVRQRLQQTRATPICKPSFLLQAKVKLVADAVWAKLTGVFAKHVLHAQVKLYSMMRTRPVCILHLLQFSMELGSSSQAWLWWLQHVWSFAQHLAAGKGKGKRQLDCAGVVSTVLSTCQRLAACHDQCDLAQLQFQVGCRHHCVGAGVLLASAAQWVRQLPLTAVASTSAHCGSGLNGWHELSSAQQQCQQ